MAVQLEIFDGNPWWLSPDIWVVPGDDPEGAPGSPIAGDNAYVWARVHNTGKDRVENATVRFYWADPSVGFDRNSANTIGTANVTLNGGQTSEVLCLTPWVPIFVNGGHECVLAEAFAPADPLPGTPDFNVPTDRHVAQRNLSVVVAKKSMFSLTFQVHNTWRVARYFNIRAEQGDLRQLRPLKGTIDPRLLDLGKQGKAHQVGFVGDVCPSEEAIANAKPHIERLYMKPFGRVGLTVVGRVEGGPVLLHVIQQANDKEAGGLSVLVVPE